jgi:hypothetical protein
MALPKLGVPYYSLNMISGKEIKYRPFLVKEEKALLMANESKDNRTIINTIKNTIASCLSPDTPLALDDIPIFELEWLLLNIRMKSVGESSKFMLRCTECKHNNPIKIDLNNVIVDNQENATEKRIMLNETVGITVQHTPYRILSNTKVLDNQKNSESNTMIVDVVAESITSVFHGDEVVMRKDFTRKEIMDFVESMTQEQLLKISEHFETVPKIRYEIDVPCEKCGAPIKRTLEGIADFF